MTEFPVDESTLALIEEALGGSYTVAEDGTHTLVGAEFSMNQLLEFFSGYDSSKLIDTGRTVEGIPVYEYPEPVFSLHDLIRALVAEIRRLKEES